MGEINAQPKSDKKIPVIIGFKNKTNTDLIKPYNKHIKYIYTTVPAIACSISEEAFKLLKENAKIAYIEIDAIIKATDEVLPWGIDRIDAEIVHPYNSGAGVKIAVVDTGIDYHHPDLDESIAGGESFVDYTLDYMDDNGHGTHVAGIISAEDNDMGVVGVAPGARLYALKVLNETGEGYVSDLVAAIEWSVANGMQIVSMSLGTDIDSVSLHEACDSAYTAGLLLMAAAGNDATIASAYSGMDTVEYPSKYDSVLAVGATKKDDTRATWSSTGPDLELAAPGVGIFSTYVGGGYATMSGTSMATPHVSGAAALVYSSKMLLSYDFDHDGTWDAPEVRKKLCDTADDLGKKGRDAFYGYGLVDADEAAPENDATPPGAITDLTASAGVFPSIHLTWTAPSDNRGINHYNIYRSHTDTIQRPTDVMAAISWGATSYTDSTGEAETTYYYAISAVDDSGNEADLSNMANATVAPEPSRDMHVREISISMFTLGRGSRPVRRAVVVVSVVDGDGNPVAGASIQGRWSGLEKGRVFKMTDANGQALLKSKYYWNRNGSLTFTIENITKMGWTYDSQSNTETFDSLFL